ncbi:PadR family transcriptional regulator [Brenneria goodwinii]|uniref:PadR family transcriptional regulator n=1 Tax=Brenneria goodwinii TaxID=1109412 RepID=UPI000EF1C045|nr:PadR family transcriptional regulator [Brenneria goodwinii]MCG8159175.1 PadR family transcriptional regulator [Brenneria goodwinii]MCG8163822.1 PadR family transcriptional regulator [Brenneria goodwinii]MCG8168436.1 PadR family transcriptional regulator [Brenneria goodwinii]MCG8173045.1 PadR family transcriptional regulator [Brenneria goodwinii]MCG8177676.1 PadR family transcriptional regulator [Brenneria goodwinii]
MRKHHYRDGQGQNEEMRGRGHREEGKKRDRAEGREQKTERGHEQGRGHGRRGHGLGEEGHGAMHRRQRLFAHGELRLVALDLLAQNPSHGYELIKAIESLTENHYAPSPGVLYPTLDFLQEQNLIAITDELNGRKKFDITDEGRQYLEQRKEELQQILERIKARIAGMALRQHPEMKRALDNIKSVLDLKVNRENTNEETLKKIIGIIDNAAAEIAQID